MSDLEEYCVEISNDNIAVIGIAGCYFDVETMDGLWRNLTGGVNFFEKILADFKSDSCIDGLEPFDPLFLGVSSGVSVRPDTRLFLETVWHLLERAGLTRESLKQDYAASVGVFVGAAQRISTNTDRHCAADWSQREEIAHGVSRYFDLQGPLVMVDTVASGTQDMVEMACRSLTSGKCKLAIAGGIHLSMRQDDAPSSRRGERGEDRAVLLPGEGVGAVLLQSLPQAIADGNTILAVIKPSLGRYVQCPRFPHALELNSPAQMTGESRGAPIDLTPTRSTEMIVLSAHTPDALRVLAWRLLNHIKSGFLGSVVQNKSGVSLADVAYTLQSCREQMNCRLAMVAGGFEEVVCGLEEYLLSKDGAVTVVQKLLGHTRAGLPIMVYRGDLDSSTQVMSLLSGSAGEVMVQALLLEGDLGNLALCWIQGAKVDWKLLQDGKSPRKVALSAYPFSISTLERQLLHEGMPSFDLFESGGASHGIRSASLNAVEIALITIWKELFGLERIGRDQNFFELGGDSQLGMHIISRVRDSMQVDLPLSYLYETPTIATMSEKIAHMAALSAMPLAIAGAEVDHDYEEGIIR